MIREECRLKKDVVTKIEKNTLKWFGHVESMDEKRLTKEIFEVVVGVNAGREKILNKGKFLTKLGKF
jgi:hypothetical protein